MALMLQLIPLESLAALDQSSQWVLPWITAWCYATVKQTPLAITEHILSGFCRSTLRFYATLSGCKSIRIPVLQISLLIRSQHVCPVPVWTQLCLCVWEMLVGIFSQLSKFEVQILFFFNNMQKPKYSNLISALFQVIIKETFLYPVVEFSISEWSGGTNLLAFPDFLNTSIEEISFIPVEFM